MSAREGALVREGAEHDSTVASPLRHDHGELIHPSCIMLTSMMEQRSLPGTLGAELGATAM